MAVREGLLVLLAEGERYGYQLKTDWEAATGGAWTINVGQIYSTLDRLVRDGLVELTETDHGDGPQKLYTLTHAGAAELHDWWAAPPATSPIPRDGLVVKVLLAVRAGPDHGLEVVTRHRTALTQSLQQLRRQMRTRDATDLAQAMVDDAMVTRIDADLRWLDQVEQRLIRSRAFTNGTNHQETPGVH